MAVARLKAIAGRADQTFMDTVHYIIFKCNTSVMVLLFALISTIMAILGVSYCTFVTGLSDFRPGGKHTVGLYSLAIYDDAGEGSNLLGCVSFPEDVQFDFFFRMSRAAGACMAACMTGTFLLLIRNIVWAPSRTQWNLARLGLTLATVSSVLTFALTTSDHCDDTDCRLSGIGIVTVFNTFIMAGLALIICIEPAPTHPWFVYWSEEHFIANRDTLALGELNRPEFVSSQELERSSQGSDGDLVFPNSQGSVFSQISVQDSLVSTTKKAVHSHRLFRYVLLSSFFVAWLLSILGIRNCTFILVGQEDQDSSMYMGVGLYTRAYYVGDDKVGCIAHSDANKDHFDGFFQSSRVFGAVAALLMSVIFVVGIAQLFSNMAKIELWLFVRFLLPCAFISEAAMGLVYFSEICNGTDGYQCVPGAIGFTVMANLTLMFTLCSACCVLPPPSNPLFARWRAEEEEDEFSCTQSLTPSSSSQQSKKIKSMLPPPTSKLGVLDEAEESVASEEDFEKKGQSSAASTTSSVSPSSSVSVRVEVSNGERKTITEITQPDGSRAMTTDIEDLNDVDLNGDTGGFQNDQEPYYMT
eukprot:CAMPEP_0172451490 /NCGR_PEP_ID=MMETSP1065-20121228/9523_1 /TAXON_ID=265537 /ORGANISM="Amphiprora paludosa, Strain CCMP125" /LENGTH=583 /DNA_ID=CAMNT_0013203453 /DNA_START=121 /DNA_END=1872 /DNA_ORIENTATION=-